MCVMHQKLNCKPIDRYKKLLYDVLVELCGMKLGNSSSDKPTYVDPAHPSFAAPMSDTFTASTPPPQ